jgi:hypothetical protein
LYVYPQNTRSLLSFHWDYIGDGMIAKYTYCLRKKVIMRSEIPVLQMTGQLLNLSPQIREEVYKYKQTSTSLQILFKLT